MNALGEAGDNMLLLGTQGTGLLSSRARRLRADYRRLGRAAASQLLHDTPVTASGLGLSGHQFLRHFRHDATA